MMRLVSRWCFLSGCLLGWEAGSAAASEKVVDFSRAVIVTPAELSGPEKKAIAMLQDEVEKRTQLRWRQSEQWPADSETPVIAVGKATALQALANGAVLPFSGTSEKRR